MKKTDKAVSDYLDSLADAPKQTIKHLDKLITSHMPNERCYLWEGTFWGGTEQTIIGYGDLVTKPSRGKPVEWFKVGLALQKNYISIYVNATQDGKYLAELYQSKLGKVKVGKASISFRRLEDLNQDSLSELLVLSCQQQTVR